MKAANDNIPATIDRLLRLPQVKAATGLSTATIYRKMDAGTFPRPLQLGPNSVAWRTSSITAWIDRLAQAA